MWVKEVNCLRVFYMLTCQGPVRRSKYIMWLSFQHPMVRFPLIHGTTPRHYYQLILSSKRWKTILPDALSQKKMIGWLMAGLGSWLTLGLLFWASESLRGSSFLYCCQMDTWANLILFHTGSKYGTNTGVRSDENNVKAFPQENYCAALGDHSHFLSLFSLCYWFTLLWQTMSSFLLASLYGGFPRHSEVVLHEQSHWGGDSRTLVGTRSQDSQCPCLGLCFVWVLQNNLQQCLFQTSDHRSSLHCDSLVLLIVSVCLYSLSPPLRAPVSAPSTTPVSLSCFILITSVRHMGSHPGFLHVHFSLSLSF